MNSMRPLSLCFFLFPALLAFTACRQEIAQEEATAVAFKRTGNTAVIRLEGEPDRLTPLLSSNNYATQVMDNRLFLPLLAIDPQTLELAPALAKSRAQVEEITDGEFRGGVAYTFEIYEEAQWDDGRPVTARDYVFTLKTALNPRVQAAAFRPYVALIRDVRIDENNPKRFTVLTNEKSIQGEEYVANTFWILPEHLYDPDGLLRDLPLRELTDPAQAEALATANPKLQQFAEQFSDQKYGRDPQFVNGCGPYKLQQWETGQQIVLLRKENWWGDKISADVKALQAYPRELVFKPVPDATTSVAALKGEELDVAYNLDPNAFQELKTTEATAERYNFFTPPTLAYAFITINSTDPKLSDRRVRLALARAVNAQEIIDNVYNGYGERLNGPVLPSAEYYNKDLEPYEFNIEQARALLAEAGWTDSDNDGIVDKDINGRRTELELELLIPSNRETSLNAALLIQDNARRAGIAVEPLAQESSVLFDRLRKRDYELGSVGRSLAPTLWNPQQNYHTKVGDNRTGFGNPETDAIIDEILITQDKERRNDLYRRLQAVIYEEVPEIPLFVPTNRLVIHKRFDPQVITPVFPGFIPHLLQLKEEFRDEAALN